MQCSSRIGRAQARLVCKIPITAEDRRKPRHRCNCRAHKPKASCAVASDHDKIPVARFSPPARAGTTARQRLICRSDHRNTSICSASVRAVTIRQRQCGEITMRGRCDLCAESGVGKIRVHGRSFPALAVGENRATSLPCGLKLLQISKYSRMNSASLDPKNLAI